MSAEYLFYFPPKETEAGTMPAFYDLVSGYNRADARAMGGRDVSHCRHHWDAYEREREAENACYL